MLARTIEGKSWCGVDLFGEGAAGENIAQMTVYSDHGETIRVTVDAEEDAGVKFPSYAISIGTAHDEDDPKSPQEYATIYWGNKEDLRKALLKLINFIDIQEN